MRPSILCIGGLFLLGKMKKMKLEDVENRIPDSEKPTSIMFLEMLIEAGKVPKAVVVANTEKKKEIYNTDEEREEYLKNLPFGD